MGEPLSDEQRERLAEAAFAEHEPALYAQENHTKLWHAVMGQMREIADALAPVVADMLAEAERRAERAERIERAYRDAAADYRDMEDRAETAEARYDALIERIKTLADEWGDEDDLIDHVAACQDFACKTCVVAACAADLRDLIGGA